MRPTFHPFLVNGPWGDPALLVRLLGQARTLFFDLGELHPLAARPVLQASHAFVSHAHIDHFCGFDTVVRYCLGRKKRFCLVGPPSITDRVEAKLGGYTWNLVGHYEEEFTVEVAEWGEASGLTLSRFECREGFVRREVGHTPVVEEAGLRQVHAEPGFRVWAGELDHHIPSLGYRLEEPMHINVATEGLERMDLAPGPWVRQLKQAVYEDAPPETRIILPLGESKALDEFLNAGAIRMSEGQMLAYVADCVWNTPSIERAVALARDAHVLYCEAAFLEEDGDRARARHHLTAAQAGELARRAGVVELRIFHFSPKYKPDMQRMIDEAAEAFGGPVRVGP